MIIVLNFLSPTVITHNYKGYNSNGKVAINGSYDVNIWYSYDNNSKTNVIARTFNYNDLIGVNSKENINDASEVIVRCLTAPSASGVNVSGNTLNVSIEKELGVEVLGDVKVKINILDDYDDYEEDLSDYKDNIDIDEDYLNKK